MFGKQVISSFIACLGLIFICQLPVYAMKNVGKTVVNGVETNRYTDGEHEFYADPTLGLGDNKPADGGAGQQEGELVEVSKVRETREEHSAVVSEITSTPDQVALTPLQQPPRDL